MGSGWRPWGDCHVNVLFAIHHPLFGGPHNQALRLNALLANSGWHMTVLLSDESGRAAERLRAGGIDVVQQPIKRMRAKPNLRYQATFARSFFRDVERIQALIRERRIDLVLVGGLANPHAAIAARRQRVPVVWQILDTRMPFLLRILLMGFVRRLADAVMFDGESLIRMHVPVGTLRAPKFVYFPPVDVGSFCPSVVRGLETRRELGIPADALTVGMVAQITPQKGIEYFIRAAAIIHARLPEVWFVIVGGQPDTQLDYAKRINAEIVRSRIRRDRIILAGERADVERCYAAMDVKLISSVPRSEGTTTTALEALACGVPVVASDVGAISEVVSHGSTGLLVPPCDPQAMAAATCLILEDSVMRAQMGRRGRLKALEFYAADICAAVHVRAFDAALLRHQRQPWHARRTIAR